jgi:hypothetical protein
MSALLSSVLMEMLDLVGKYAVAADLNRQPVASAWNRGELCGWRIAAHRHCRRARPYVIEMGKETVWKGRSGMAAFRSKTNKCFMPVK